MLIKLDKERNLRLSMNVMEKFEEMTGKSLFQIKDKSELSIRELKILLWLSLLKDDPELTLENAGDLVGIENMVEVVSILMGSSKKGSSPLSDGGPGQS